MKNTYNLILLLSKIHKSKNSYEHNNTYLQKYIFKSRSVIHFLIINIICNCFVPLSDTWPHNIVFLLGFIKVNT